MNMQLQESIVSNFRTPRYDELNRLRWSLFLKMGIPLKDQVVFEPGAGIGDQTEFLLSQGVKHVFVNDGRRDNLQIIRERFPNDPRLTFIDGNLEEIDHPAFNIRADLVFLWGVYYHINDSLDRFHIMQGLTRIAPLVVFDYLENDQDGTDYYGYDNPSTSVSQYAIRPTTKTMLEGLRKTWGYAYLPKEQMNWHDPLAEGTPRRLAVGSKTLLNNDNLILQT